jgi:hypothetical protein
LRDEEEKMERLTCPALFLNKQNGARYRTMAGGGKVSFALWVRQYSPLCWAFDSAYSDLTDMVCWAWQQKDWPRVTDHKQCVVYCGTKSCSVDNYPAKLEMLYELYEKNYAPILVITTSNFDMNNNRA